MLGINYAVDSSNLSQNVKTLLTNSWTIGTKKQYSPYFNNWIMYCCEDQISPVIATSSGAEFLAVVS